MKKIVVCVCIVVVLLAFVLPLVLVNAFKVDFAQLGTYGDFFGSFNALVSLLAFIGLIYTIHLQRKDLELQREELKLTREELKKQAEAQEKQAELIAEQINKDTRPYINVFWAGTSLEPYLVVRNVGKSTGLEFKLQVPYEKNTELYSIAKGFARRLNCFEIDAFPSGEEYIIPLFDNWKDAQIETYIKNYRNRIYELVQRKVKLTLEVSFVFKNSVEQFETIYDLGNTPIPRNERDLSSVKIIQSLNQIKTSIDELKNSISNKND